MIIPSVIGLGYVGLPIFLKLQKKFHTIGFDIDNKRIRKLKNNKDINLSSSKNELFLKKRSFFTNNEEDLKKSNFFIITVPTSINKSKKPILNHIKNAFKTVSKYLKKGDIVFVESTIYPGLTKKLSKNYLEKKFKSNKDFYLGYSPERINPGDKFNTISNINKIVAFETNNILAKSKIFKVYRNISKKIIISKKIENAEMSKLVENIQRDINIAYMNQILLYTKKLDLNFRDIIKLTRTKWNFINISPGLVGGDCLPVNSYYLSHILKKFKMNTNFLINARKINDGMVDYVIDKIVSKIKNQKSKILLCGMSYKPDVPDLRNSLSLKLFKKLKKRKFNVVAFDPIIDEINSKKNKIEVNIKNFNKFDLIVIMVKHRQISSKIKKNIKNKNKILDVFNFE